MFFKKLLAFCSFLMVANSALASDQNQPTMILVHGALFTKNSWHEVQKYLQKQGVSSIAINLPGRANDHISPKTITLTTAVTKLCDVINLQKNPVILVGHSQGGAVITQAVNQCGSKIKGLIYVAAVVPLSGESVFKDLSDQDNANFDPCGILDKKNLVLHVNKNGPIKKMFMDDVNIKQANEAINEMVSEPINIGESELSYDTMRFDLIPKFYIETLNDKIISPETQKKIEGKVKFNKIYSMKTSHSPFLSQPKLFSEYLIEIRNLYIEG